MKPCGLLAGILNNAKYATRQRARAQAKPVLDILKYETFEVDIKRERKRGDTSGSNLAGGKNNLAGGKNNLVYGKTTWLAERTTWFTERTTWFTEKQLGSRELHLFFPPHRPFEPRNQVQLSPISPSERPDNLFLTAINTNFLKNRFPPGPFRVAPGGPLVFFALQTFSGEEHASPPVGQAEFP